MDEYEYEYEYDSELDGESELEVKYRDIEVTSNASGVACNEYIIYADNSSTEIKTLRFFDGLIITIVNSVISEDIKSCIVQVNNDFAQCFDSEESAEEYINSYLNK